MTVPELDFHPTDSLAHLFKFYPAEIHVPHHQLRNFISTAYEDKVFFVHNYDIYLLDLQKQQRSLVATVPFEARCLAANHGWICVGGETKGDCAFVRIGEATSGFGQYGHDLIVDMLGKEIVNSMTIHKIPGQSSGQPDETVVLISNNDKSVTLYSLSQQEVLCVLPHPVPMNYASMSPDCTMIAAVGDSSEVYFYHRQDVEDEDSKQKSPVNYQEYNWRSFAVPRIPAGEGVFDDYSFAIAFSPSGQYCAVSAQGGAISVFDMQLLREARRNVEAENAILCTFRSSRPSLCGCVRSLSFAPEPWDLLAWTEDHGTIGIADIRRSFVRRQCIPLNRDAAEVVEMENLISNEYRNMDVKERLKHQYMHRMRALRGHPPVGGRSLAEGLGLRGDSTYSIRESANLDARERSVLEALETTIDDVEHYSLQPYSVNYNTSPSIRSSATSAEFRREYDVQLLNPGVRAQEAHVPRRRQSVVLSETTVSRHLSPPETNRALMTASPAQMSEDLPTPPMSTNDLTPSNNTSSQPLPYNIPPSDPWHVIEAQLAADRAAERSERETANRGGNPASLGQIEAAIYAERQISTQLERQLADERRLSALLRTELELRERLLEARQQELESQRTRDARLSPSLERVLQRQLQSEQENGRQRSNEIESEILHNSRGVERLVNERAALLLRAMTTRDTTTSAQSTAAATGHSSENEELDRVLRQLEEQRRNRRHRIQDLQLQLRRAESRLEIASAQSGSEPTRERNERVADARFLAAATRPGHTAVSLRRAQQMDQYGVPYGSRATPSAPSAYTNRIRAARHTETATGETRSTLPRTSELAGRVSESDMRLARSMLHAAVMDANGNWIAGHGIRRAPVHSIIPSGAGTLPARAAPVDDVVRDSGVGTAGIGWSPDGSHLYAGSEVGIFEFKVNLRDRMQFPSLQMR